MPSSDHLDPAQLDALRAALAGQYRIEAPIGQGGMATVFLAHDLRHDRRVALKVLDPDLSRALDARRFTQEIQLTARLQHRGIVSVYDSGSAVGLLWYAMTHVKGESLRARLTREPQLPLPEALRIITEAGRALAAAHAQGIVHRDLKPENLLLDPDGAVWLADFGVARAADTDTLTRTGLTVGTPMYMSPEQAAGGARLDARSDIYSLACVLYEMLAGEPPYQGPTPQAVAAKHLHAPVPDVRILRETVPPGVQQALATALAKSPADRFPTVDAFLAALASGGSARPGRHGWLLAGVGAVVALLAAGAAWLVPRGAPARAAVAAADSEPPMVVVPYFDVRSPDSVARQIADQVTEDLIQELGGENGFRVISRNGVRPYRNRAVPLDSVIRALGGTIVVDGEVIRRGDDITVQGDLLDRRLTVRSSFSGSLSIGRLAELELSIEGQIADQLRRRFGRPVQLRGVLQGTQNNEARLLVRAAGRARDDAHAAAERHNVDDLRASELLLSRADSLLVEAHRLDADWLWPVVERGRVWLDLALLRKDAARIAALEHAAALADSVLARDPGQAGALELRGMSRWQRATGFEGAAIDTIRRRLAEGDLRGAVDRDSTLARAWATLSFLLMSKASFEEASLAAHRALAADAWLENASTVYFYIWLSELQLGDYGEATSWCARGRERFPGQWRFVECDLTTMRPAMARRPDPDSAWALVARLEQLDPAAAARQQGRAYHAIYRRVVAGTISAQAGDTARGLAELARAKRDLRAEGLSYLELSYDEAYLRLVLGQPARAIRLLRDLFRARPQLREYVSRDPLFAPIRDSILVQ